MKNNIVRIFSLLVLALPMMVLAQEGQEGQKSQAVSYTHLRAHET